MNDVLHVSVQENGLYSSVPYIMWIAASISFGYWSDWLIATNRLSITNARKLFITVGKINIFWSSKSPNTNFVIPFRYLATLVDAGFVLAAAYAGCNALIVGVFFALSVGAQGVQTSCLLINPIDISPNYAATVTGFISGMGSSMGLLVPVMISFITPNVCCLSNFYKQSDYPFSNLSFQSLQSEWRIVFWLTFCIQIAKIAIYNVWGTAEIQPWNDPHDDDNTHDLSHKNVEKEKSDKIV